VDSRHSIKGEIYFCNNRTTLGGIILVKYNSTKHNLATKFVKIKGIMEISDFYSVGNTECTGSGIVW
jgi:hypothetical protein